MKTDTDQKAPAIRSLFSSPVGKKILTGITGLGLILFVLMHVSGNLSYFNSSDAYNSYSHFLLSLGPLLYVVELGLVAFFAVHAVLGIRIYLGKRRARTHGYKSYASRGKPSMQTFSSRSMIVTGILLLLFLFIHIKTFKYGTYYETVVDGVPMRDLARLLTETFQSPVYTFGYVAIMVLLGVHLRHGFWSAFQSLGAMNPRLTPVVYGLGVLIALYITIGFLVLPLWIFFTGGNA
ncbi:MAG: succinate dehydrogenase cytochrome b subunit [Rhodothermales bacterium]|nr:succinate dehydrogenase cytochrome b subunit [Rhodothermales bacterium]